MIDHDSVQIEPVYREAANRALIEIARNLRQKETTAEDILWAALRNRRLMKLKFRRQHPIANTTYVVDFLCYESRVVVELDGEIHRQQIEEDHIRQSALTNLGYTVLRFSNETVFKDLPFVLKQIALACQNPVVRNTPPLPEGEGQG